MFRIKLNTQARMLAYSASVLALVAGALAYGGIFSRVDAKGSTAAANSLSFGAPVGTFPANAGTLGFIPDSNISSPVCQNESTTFREVTFSVSGITGSPSAVAVNMNASHTYVQDMEVTLTAPSGQSLLLFSATGTTATSPNACASNNFNAMSTANTYTFSDSASANWWTTVISSGTPVPTSTNRTVVSGIGGVPSGIPATTSLNSAFASATANGTWTLKFRDRGSGDTGNVTAANLMITGGSPSIVRSPVDFNGDGKTDYAIARNTGGGSSGQVTWMECNNPGISNGCVTVDAQGEWGLASDFYVPADFDGDGKSDIAVWRAGAPTVAAFYILQSSTNTLRADPFGQLGDDPTVIADYTGDGKVDPAVYRVGHNPGDLSYFYYRASSGSYVGQIVYEQWGQTGDYPAPGDYDGDGKADFVIQRASGTDAVFWLRTNTTNNISVVFWGGASDVIVPGDYDGDGKTDIATLRGVDGHINWYVRPSSAPPNTNLQLFATFGLSASDYPVQGDYDGDGKTDVAVWRPNPDPTQNFFYIRQTSTGALMLNEWGSDGDYPVANYNSH